MNITNRQKFLETSRLQILISRQKKALAHGVGKISLLKEDVHSVDGLRALRLYVEATTVLRLWIRQVM